MYICTTEIAVKIREQVSTIKTGNNLEDHVLEYSFSKRFGKGQENTRWGLNLYPAPGGLVP